MKLSIQLALALATALIAVVMAYSELRHGLDDLQLFKKDTQSHQRATARKIERLQVHVSHLQSWLDEAKVKR